MMGGSQMDALCVRPELEATGVPGKVGRFVTRPGTLPGEGCPELDFAARPKLARGVLSQYWSALMTSPNARVESFW